MSDLSFMQDGRLYEFIRLHGRAHSFNARYGQYQFSGGYWETSEETREALAQEIAMSSYDRPKWWHFWAWNENKPSKKVWQRVLELRAVSPSP